MKRTIRGSFDLQMDKALLASSQEGTIPFEDLNISPLVREVEELNRVASVTRLVENGMAIIEDGLFSSTEKGRQYLATSGEIFPEADTTSIKVRLTIQKQNISLS